MKYKYGNFSEKQLEKFETQLHNDVHKLLLYKDRNISKEIFKTEEDFEKFFKNLLFRLDGLNSLFDTSDNMVNLIATLQGALLETKRKNFRYSVYRKAILDSQGYIDIIFKGGDVHAKP